MNKGELVDALVSRLGDKRTANEALDAVLTEIQRAVVKGEKVSIAGFGVFEKRERRARMARNPRTGEPVKVRKSSAPAFRAGQGFKDLVTGKKRLPATPRGRSGATTTRGTSSGASAVKSTVRGTTTGATGRKTTAATKTTGKKAAPKRTAKRVPAKKTTAAKAGKKTATGKATTKRVPEKNATPKKAATKKSTTSRSAARTTATGRTTAKRTGTRTTAKASKATGR